MTIIDAIDQVKSGSDPIEAFERYYSFIDEKLKNTPDHIKDAYMLGWMMGDLKWMLADLKATLEVIQQES